MLSNIARRQLFLRLSSFSIFNHNHSSSILIVHKFAQFLSPVHCLKCHFCSSSSRQPLVPCVREETNWAQVDENGLHNLLEAHNELKCEKDMDQLERSQRAKLAAVRNLHEFLLNGPKEPSTSSIWRPLNVEARAKCDQLLGHFEQRMAEEMKKIESTKELAIADSKKQIPQIERAWDAFKKFYLRVMFRLFHELYRQSAEEVKQSGQKGIRRQRAEKSQVDKMEAAFDIVPEMTELKRCCFLGAFWLSDGQSFRFFDHLNTKFRCSSLDGQHVNFICDIATTAKEALILEPLIDLAVFLPPNFLHLAKVFNSLALIYGKTNDFDKLENLWRKLDRMKGKIPYAEQSRRVKPILARIEHFYRRANRKAPGDLLAALKRLSGQPFFISMHAKRRENEMENGESRQNDL